MKQIFVATLLLQLLILQAPSALAQDETSRSEQNQDYLFCESGKQISVSITNEITTTVPGVPMTFVATIKNDSPYTMTEVDLLGRVFKREGQASLIQDQLLDTIITTTRLTLPAGEATTVTFEWLVPNNAESGEYTLNPVLLVAGQQLDSNDSVRGGAVFEVIAEETSRRVSRFNIEDTTLNGVKLTASTVPRIETGKSVQVKTTITNTSNDSKTVPVQWNQYAVHSFDEKNIRFTKTEVVTLNPKETKELVYDAQPQPDAAVLITATTQDGQSKHFLEVPFIQSGGRDAYIYLPTIQAVPFVTGEPHSVSACARLVGDPDDRNTTLAIKLTSASGDVLFESSKDLIHTEPIAGYAESFIPKLNQNSVTLTATLIRSGVVSEVYTKTFTCEANCFPENATQSWLGFLKQHFMTISASLVLIVLLLIVLLHFIRRRRINIVDEYTTPLAGLFFILILPAILFFNFKVVEAAVFPSFSSYNNYSIQNNYSYTGGTRTEIGIINRGNVSCPAVPSPTSQTCEDQAYMNCVNLCAAGAYNTCDIRRASIADTPDGGDGQIVWRCFGYSGGVLTPTSGAWGNGTSHDGLSYVNSRYHLWSAITSSAQANTPPNPPRIIGPSTGETGAITTFELRGVDPDGDQVRYGVDWNNDGTIDLWMPGSGYVNSDTPRDIQRDWVDMGSYTFRALTQDSRGANSGWTSHTITMGSSCSSANIERESSSDCQVLGYDKEYPEKYVPGSATSRTAYINWSISGSENQCAVVYGSGSSKGLLSIWEGGSCSSLPPSPPNLCSAAGITYGTYTAEEQTQYRQQCLDAGYTTIEEMGQEDSQFGMGGAGVGECRVNYDRDTNDSLYRYTIYKSPACATSDPVALLAINGSEGPLSVTRGTPLNLDWSAENVSTCSKFGANWGSGEGISLIGTETIMATVSDTYLINCNGTIDSVNVTVVNQGPEPPIITHPTRVADFGVNTTFAIEGTDPDGDNVFYEIDWNNDGAHDATSATVASGVSVSAVRNWLVTGPQTFQARTVDINGARSTWTQHTITINIPAPATATLEASVNGGSWSSSDQTVNTTDSVALRWSSTNASSCSGSGSGFDTGNSTSGSDNVNTPAANNSITFQVDCTGAGGDGSDTLTITTRQLPNLTTSQNTSPQYGTFDPVTGTYSQVTVYFRTQNNGGSDTTNSADYRFELDLNNDGSYETNITRADGIGTIAVGGGENDSETVSGPIPFGTHGVRITADSSSPDKVDETDEADNVYTGTITTTPADPGLSITANPLRVQNGQNTIIDWSATNPYSMNCSLFGPGMVTRNFNLLSATAADRNISAGPITAKSEYTLRCTAAGTTFTDTVTVEAQGVIEEI